MTSVMLSGRSLSLPAPLSNWEFYRVYGLGVALKGNLKLELISFQGVKHNAILVFLASISLRKMGVAWNGRRRSP